MARVLTPQQFTRDLQHQIRYLSGVHRMRFLKNVGGQVMHNMVLTRLARGGFNKVGDWKSDSKETKFSGRFSASYHYRPSGAEVNASSIRMVDTTKFADCFNVLSVNANHVTVGPDVKLYDKGEVIAERQEKIGNHIVGFSPEINKALAEETQYYLDQIADGHLPPALPRSRLGRVRPAL